MVFIYFVIGGSTVEPYIVSSRVIPIDFITFSVWFTPRPSYIYRSVGTCLKTEIFNSCFVACVFVASSSSGSSATRTGERKNIPWVNDRIASWNTI